MPKEVTLNEYSLVSEFKAAVSPQITELVVLVQSNVEDELGHTFAVSDRMTIRDFGDYLISTGILENNE